MKDKIIFFLGIGISILILVIVCMFYANKSLRAEKNALSLDVERYKQSLIEKDCIINKNITN